jgi:hypothetical protein
MYSFKNTKYLNKTNAIIYENLFQSINSKILYLNNKLQILKISQSKDNVVYHKFCNIDKNKELVFNKIEMHLEQLFMINKDQNVIIKSLEIIHEIFPESTMIESDNIIFNPYREYIFPINFVDLILRNFSSELHYRNRNEIIFSSKSIKRYRMYYDNNVKRTGINRINYNSYINKVLSIAQFGYSVNNNSVHLASIVKIHRNF